jgi:Zn-dependent peptidase ImmA (M78 family)/transcriptional regulator with XRE-family HTH domain
MARATNINPEILSWARTSAGFSREEAADRLGLTTSERRTAVEKLEDLESGSTFPTRAQLSKIATSYRRPLLTFYLASPPVRGDRGEDFRTLPAQVSMRDNAALDALLRDIRARQEMVRALLEEEGDAKPLGFVGSTAIEAGVEAVVDSIADTLGFKGRRQPGGSEDLFKDLRRRSERAGIFVLLAGDLGSHHSAISETVFRGFAIADPIAPFIVINDHDAKNARPFTLVHELAHVWLGATGVSGSPDDVEPRTRAGRIERFCDDVAGEFLLPAHAFTQIPDELGDDETTGAVRDVITQFANRWRVSEPMIAHRFHRLGWISRRAYRELASEYAARWAAVKQRERDKAKDSESGPSYYTVKRFKLGEALIEVVRRTLRENALSHTKAAKVLGVGLSSVEPLIRRVEESHRSTPRR